MPAAKNPDNNDFYVYRFTVNGKPFYVGIGRDKRGSDRIRYVEYLMRREKEGKPVKWSFSMKVIAEILKRGHQIQIEYPYCHLVRSEALKLERQEIASLLLQKHELANIHHNPDRLATVDALLVNIL
jgi:hypothetical protein